MLAVDGELVIGKTSAKVLGSPVFIPFVVENKEGCFCFTIKSEFSCDDLVEFLLAMQEILFLNPREMAFNFIHSETLPDKVVTCFIDIMENLINKNIKLQVICYNQDYMIFFRNVPILKKVDFVLVKKV